MSCSTGEAPMVEDKVLGTVALLQETDVGVSTDFTFSYCKEDEDIQDIKKYFARPRYIYGGVVPVARGSIFSATVSVSNIVNNWFPSMQTRLIGTQGITFTMVFTLQVSATPMNSGLIAMGFQHRNASSSAFARLGPSFITNLPHVRFDPTMHTSVTLRVPYVGPLEYIKIHDFPSYHLGSLFLTNVVSALSAATVPSMTYKILVHLEDIKLFGVYPQSFTTFVAQGVVEKEQEAVPMSKVLASASGTLKLLGKAVPSLSSVASTTSWMAAKMAGAAASFGFSRPINFQPVVRVLPQRTGFEFNVDMPSASVVVAPTANNYTRIDGSLAGTDVDEMALSHVLSQYNQLACGEMNTSQGHGSCLWAAHVCPAAMWFRNGQPNGAPLGNLDPYDSYNGVGFNSFQPTGIFFWSSMFRMWRGSFLFRVTFAKTQYHSGRVLMQFIPHHTVLTWNKATTGIRGPEISTFGTFAQPFGLSAIIDLKQASTFEFEVPYECPNPWSVWDHSIGSVTMTVIDPLIGSAGVATAVPYLVEVCSKDMQLACPRTPLYCVHEAGTFIQQGYSENVAEVTTGEVVTSAKQLISIPYHTRLGSMSASLTTLITLPPWWYQPKQVTTAPAVAAARSRSFGYGGNIASCYNFVRGSAEYHVYSTPANNFSMSVAQVSSDYAEPASTTSTVRAPSGGANVRVVSLAGDPLHVKLPYYAQNVRARVADYFDHMSNAGLWNPAFGSGAQTFTMSAASTTTSASVSPAVYELRLVTGTSATPTITLSCQAADDAQLSGYIGPPPLWLPGGVAATAYDPDALP